MTDLIQLLHRYSISYDRKIKNICSPLLDYLAVPVFTYGFVEANGRFGYLTNAIEFNEYYFSKKLYLDNPYFSHPALFRSGQTLSPCTFDDETQKMLCKKFRADHLFLDLKANESKMEFFIFAQENVDSGGGNQYLSRLDFFHKFSHYFQREARELIESMRADQFNIKTELGKEKFESVPSVPLVKNDPKTLSFLKTITRLSPQEQRCLELFKQGHSAQSTGALLGLSQRTVEHYFENIKNKVGCYSKYDLLNY